MNHNKKESPCTAATVTEATHKPHIQNTTSRSQKQGNFHVPMSIKLYNMVSRVTPIPRKMPVFNQVGAGLLNTVEGCVLWNCERYIYDTVNQLFKMFPPETKHALSFSPKDGEFAERARLWKVILWYALPPEQAYTAFCSIIQWYKQMKINRASREVTQ